MSGPVKMPVISVVTPTLNRPDLLFGRCMPSVQAQTRPSVEHVIVNDGPYAGGPGLDSALLGRAPVFLSYLDRHQGRCAARRRGIELAKGDYIAYLDDDDAFRPNHLEILFEFLMQHPEAGFVYSQMASRQPNGEIRIIGGDPPAACHIGSPMILHRREILEVATWGPDDPQEDWQLVERWLGAGVKYAFLSAVTCDVWPAVYWPRTS